MHKVNLWDRNNPLYFYSNDDTIDEIIVRIYGELIESITQSKKDGGKGSCGIKAKFGSILSLLGLGEIEGNVSGEISFEDVKSTVTKVSFENKLASIVDFYKRNNQFPYIDTYTGVELIRNNNAFVSDWIQKDLKIESNSFVGQILGLYEIRRIHPPTDNPGFDLTHDFLNKPNTIWEF